MGKVHLIYFPQWQWKVWNSFDLSSNPLAHFNNLFYVATLFDLFMKNAEGAFNLFSSVAVESLQFLLLRHFMR